MRRLGLRTRFRFLAVPVAVAAGLAVPAAAQTAAEVAGSEQAAEPGGIPDAAVPEPAAELDQAEAARLSYEAGTAAFDAGRYPDALAEFQESYRALPSLRTLYVIGLCQHALFRYPDAVESFRQYLAEGGDRVPPDLRNHAEGLIAQMVRDMGRLRVTVSEEGAAILVDGVEVGRSPLAAPVDVGPGAHVVEARRDGFESAVARVTVGAAGAQAVDLRLTPLAPRPALVRVDAGGVAAAVFVDDSPAGTAPLDVEVEPGEHVVRVEAEGYDSASRTVTAEAGRVEPLAFALVPNSPAPAGGEAGETGEATEEEGASLWWLWTAIGVVVAGGAVTAGVLLWPEKESVPDWQWRVR